VQSGDGAPRASYCERGIGQRERNTRGRRNRNKNRGKERVKKNRKKMTKEE
jgi:hypothetical protein